MFMNKITDYVKNILTEFIFEGSKAVDLTMGNGNDTLFLAQKVGQTGKVYAFDIQKVAIINTEKLLKINKCYNRVLLIEDGHENINKYIEEKIHVAMMNLGYLPNGNHNIITKPKTTIKAISNTLDLLENGGIFSIVIYYGHIGGKEEKDAVLKYLSNLDNKKYDVFSYSYVNRTNAPILNIIRKK